MVPPIIVAQPCVPVRGRPKSGRIWKTEKKRFSSLGQSKPMRADWETKLNMRKKRADLLSLISTLKEQKTKDGEVKKEKRETAEKKKLEKRLKAEIVTPLTNPGKLKRLNKKKLKKIRKVDSNMNVSYL